MVDFHNFFDGENITQQDLVAWINLGMHHLVCVIINDILLLDAGSMEHSRRID